MSWAKTLRRRAAGRRDPPRREREPDPETQVGTLSRCPDVPALPVATVAPADGPAPALPPGSGAGPAEDLLA